MVKNKNNANYSHVLKLKTVRIMLQAVNAANKPFEGIFLTMYTTNIKINVKKLSSLKLRVRTT